MNMDARLCYVTNQWAYFTTQPLDKQWGDDWNDWPYEHNAGEPYEYGDRDRERGDQPWEIVKIAFEGPLFTPAGLAGGRSCYSVEQINAGAVAWLTKAYTKPVVNIYAGATVAEFINLVKEAGGKVYLPDEATP